MTEPETFLSRWARLKHKSAADHHTEESKDVPQSEAVEAVAPSAGATENPPHGEAACEPFNADSLPPIEAIGVDTDVRAFLHSSVPAELTRAALRRAWVSDPEIRDFVGIAENQWDFTDPAAIPGFGPLRETHNLPALLAQAVGSLDKVSGRISERSAWKAQLPADMILAHDQGGVSPQQIADILPEVPPGPAVPERAKLKQTGAAREENRAAEAYPDSGWRRHGSAMPR
jgi:hypothetical protein